MNFTFRPDATGTRKTVPGRQRRFSSLTGGNIGTITLSCTALAEKAKDKSGSTPRGSGLDTEGE
jgi:hypothetical protein